VKRGGGAQLLREPDRLAEIVRAIARAVRIPVTVKIRSGWDDASLNAVEIARRVEDEGAAMLAVHGRTRVQLYSGRADWDVVATIRESLRIPVLGSGDVTTPEQAAALLRSGAADGVMIGRAAMSNPWIFAQVVAQAGGRKPAAPDAAELVDALTVFRDALRETLPDHAFIGRYRGIACHFVKGMRGSAAARAAIGAVKTVEEIGAIFADFVLGEAEMPLPRVATG
jgi:nifR3 family TIM-barrel protein